MQLSAYDTEYLIAHCIFSTFLSTDQWCGLLHRIISVISVSVSVIESNKPEQLTMNHHALQRSCLMLRCQQQLVSSLIQLELRQRRGIATIIVLVICTPILLLNASFQRGINNKKNLMSFRCRRVHPFSTHPCLQPCNTLSLSLLVSYYQLIILSHSSKLEKLDCVRPSPAWSCRQRGG